MMSGLSPLSSPSPQIAKRSCRGNRPLPLRTGTNAPPSSHPLHFTLLVSVPHLIRPLASPTKPPHPLPPVIHLPGFFPFSASRSSSHIHSATHPAPKTHLHTVPATDLPLLPFFLATLSDASRPLGIIDCGALAAGAGEGLVVELDFLPGIKASSSCSGVGLCFSDAAVLGGIKMSAPSHGVRRSLMDAARTLGGFKEVGLSPGFGHRLTDVPLPLPVADRRLIRPPLSLTTTSHSITSLSPSRTTLLLQAPADTAKHGTHSQRLSQVLNQRLTPSAVGLVDAGPVGRACRALGYFLKDKWKRFLASRFPGYPPC